ncbi:recombinase family protein [Nonomuraea polychroma]|uniref:recombinase family protein n=1 Tax=Nonomuraea polychroma TaxID=46176 RepID=UPI001F4DD21D
MPKLDRLARSVPDARVIGDTLVARGVRLSLGGSVYDPSDPMSKMFFNMLAVFAESEADLLKMRTREGMATARSRGRLRGRAPKQTARQQAELVRTHATGDYTIAELMEVFSVGRATVHRVFERAAVSPAARAEDAAPAS